MYFIDIIAGLLIGFLLREWWERLSFADGIDHGGGGVARVGPVRSPIAGTGWSDYHHKYPSKNSIKSTTCKYPLTFSP